MFISLEGIDGAGKTTLSAALASELEHRGNDIMLFQKKEVPNGLDPYVKKHLAALVRLIWDEADQQGAQLLGDAHWIRLMASYFALISDVIIDPARVVGRTVLVDNWYYKFIARMSVNTGRPRREFEDLFAGIPEPTAVIFLDVDPSVAMTRKKRFTHGELGKYQRSTEAKPHSFIEYQSKVAKVYRRLAHEKQWLTIAPGPESPEQIAVAIARDLSL